MIKLENVDNGREFDWGRTSKEYAKYRDIYPEELYEKLHALGVSVKGQDWLDIGTGSGVLPRSMYHYGANITAVDLSENQIEEAKRLSAESNMNIKFKACPAEETGFGDNSFDSITAAQCFWYFDSGKIVSEIKRMIKPEGVFVKVFMSWVKDDPVAEKSYNLVKKYNPDWNSSSSAVKDLRTHYFPDPIMDSFYADLKFTRESWNGRMMACRGVLGSMSDDALKGFSEEHGKYMNELDEFFMVKHKIFIIAYRINK